MGLEKNKLKFNPLSNQFDLVTKDNHSYKQIPTNRTGNIRSNQQMIVDGMLVIDGQLNIDGELSILGEVDLDSLPPYHIQSGETFHIANRKQFFSGTALLLDGYLINDGMLILG